MDRCACGCPQDRHRMGRGGCKDCPRFDCEGFEPTGFVEIEVSPVASPLTAEDYAEHFPVELLDVTVEPPPAATVDAPRGIDAAVRPGNAPFADTSGEGPGSAPVEATASEVQPSAELAPRASGGLVVPADPPLLTDESGCSLFVPLQGVSAEAVASLAASVDRRPDIRRDR